MNSETDNTNRPASGDTPAAESMDAEEMARRIQAVAHEHWGWLLTMGILFVLLGTIGLGMTVALTLTSIIFLGAFMIVGGVFQAIYAFRVRKQRSGGATATDLLLALLYVVAGIWVIMNPAMASVLATAMIGGFLAAVGILRIVAAFQKKPAPGWGWLLAGGIASIVLAVLIFMHWPSSALWIIGLFIAIEMIFHGWAYIILALAARKANPDGSVQA